MKTFEGIFAGREIVLLYEGEDKPCHLYSRIVDHDIVRIDDTFPNVRKASAFLASELGYGPACDFLHANEIPYASGLWNLNHSGPPMTNRKY